MAEAIESAVEPLESMAEAIESVVEPLESAVDPDSAPPPLAPEAG